MIDEKKLIEYINNMSDECNLFRWRSAKKIKEGLRDIIQRQPQIGGWIPCSERLPEEPFGCLVTVIDTNPMTLEDFENILPYHVGYSEGQWNDEDGEQIPFEVVAWQPLPEPYKLEE